MFRNFSLSCTFIWLKVIFYSHFVQINHYFLLKKGWPPHLTNFFPLRLSNKTCFFEGNRSPQPTVKLRSQNLVLSYIPHSLVALGSIVCI